MVKNKKPILITGGAGFIGSYLTEKLLGQEAEVFIIDDLSTGKLKNISHLKSKKLHFIKGSVLDAKKVEKIVRQVGAIYHLAAAVGVKTIMNKPLSSFLNNLRGTEVVLEAAAKAKIPVLLTSTSEVYGKNEKIPFKEESDRIYGSAYNIRWGYGLSKAGDEFLALAYFREKNLPVTVVRLFNVIGPKQSEAYGMVVPRFIKQALSGAAISIYGDGYQTRCFANVKDVVGALVSLMANSKSAGQIFNLGSDEEISIKELAEKVKKLTANRSKISFTSYDKAYGFGFEDMMHRKPDLSKIKQFIGYRPRVTLEQSLKEIINYFRSS